MFIHIPEPRPREGIAPTLELQIRARLDNAPTEHVGEPVTISSPQYETFIAQCTEALQRDKSIDLEVAPASAGDTETITIVNDGQYTITLTAVPDLPVLETRVEGITWSADGRIITPAIRTATGTVIPVWSPAILAQAEAYLGGTVRYVETAYGPIPCTPQGTVIIDAAIATSIRHARV